ncbi:GNAT family N-acetyltransferase [Kineosporia succinea]|uniref:N-acetyltransferase domain-containing protein n=1 Tax=Kineosporia succinea TaxID=84632 RepID=A0ABT9PEZ6_9ACTN|nr:GNAT family N-acetyltransferase [Kineosporia succinea]MDP9830745.1 hypothetical protein [Kineosporia succinea]
MDLLKLYDDQLRTGSETPGQVSDVRLGPLRLVTLPGGRGFVTYRDLGGADAATIGRLVGEALEHFRADASIEAVRWKARAHDTAPGLHEALLRNGFEPARPESIMVGEAAVLATGGPVPQGVTVRRVTTEAEIRAMSAAADEAFGDPPSGAMADLVLHRMRLDPSIEAWVAEAEGRIVGAGRLDPVPASEFAGLWGGSVLTAWRGRGVYRALTAARARAALAAGRTLIHCDSTEFSRPLLERSGLVKVSSVTPYAWKR